MLCPALGSPVQEVKQELQRVQLKAVKMMRGLKLLSREGRLSEVAEHWNRHLTEVVESPSLEIFKTVLDTIPCSR